ncbi:MAG: FprA family A-type flavoprotein, partial [Candidatus Odinarchaeia archaeon]
PWVHWPETMITYLYEDKILFPCDFLGSHYSPSKILVKEDHIIYESAKRYFAEIMMPFRNNIKKHLARLKELDIEIIAPSHGPVYLKPEFIISAYEDWVSDTVKNIVVIPYISMHGSIKIMVQKLVKMLTERGIEVKPFNLTHTDIGELAMSLIDAATLVVGSPTVLTGPHPSVLYATYLANILRPKTKFLTIIGSYGWGGRMIEILKSLTNFFKAEILEPVLVKGYPKEDDLKKLENLADTILRKHKELGIL